MTSPRRVLLPVLLFCLTCPTHPSEERRRDPSQTAVRETCLVTRISDGDTIHVRFATGLVRRVRLIGVDTPERNDQVEDKRFWAEMATRFAAQNLLDRTVHLSYDLEREDKYGRLLAYVWTGGPGSFNEKIIREGYSAAYLKFPFRADYRAAFREAEADAQRARKGIWGGRVAAMITTAETGSHLGDYISVRFRCGRATEGRKYLFFWSDDRRFQALLLKNMKPGFTQSARLYMGKEMLVTGVLEGSREFRKLYVLFPRQVMIQ